MAAENFLTRKVGPLPAWGWVAVGAGVFVIYRLRKNSQAASTAASSGLGGVAPSGYTTSGGYGSEPSASLQTPGGFAYSGPVSGLSNPTVSGLFANPSPAIAATSGSTPSGNTGVASNYLPVSSTAALSDIGAGIPVYQSGQEAIGFASTYGGSAAGLDPNAYYQLSAPAVKTATGLPNFGPLYVKQ